MFEQRMIITDVHSSISSRDPYILELKGQDRNQGDHITGGKLKLEKEDLERFGIYRFAPFELIDKILVCSFEEIYLFKTRDLKNYYKNDILKIESLIKSIITSTTSVIPSVGRYWFSTFYYLGLSNGLTCYDPRPKFEFKFAIDKETFEKYQSDLFSQSSQTCFLLELSLINRY